MAEDKSTLRLTLRTLLAYLDDELDPQQAQQIGQQLKSSPQAQEVVKRITTIVRQRRLNIDDGSDAADPNDVAEYLDSALPAEQVAGFEQQCLESDAKLAEVAAVHQILSIVLGEPAPVTSEQRRRLLENAGLNPGRLPPPNPEVAVAVIGPSRPEIDRIPPRPGIEEKSRTEPTDSLTATLLTLALIGLLGFSAFMTLSPPAEYQAAGPSLIAPLENLEEPIDPAPPAEAPEPGTDPALSPAVEPEVTPAAEPMVAAAKTPEVLSAPTPMAPVEPEPTVVPAVTVRPATDILTVDVKASGLPYPLVSRPGGIHLLADGSQVPVSPPATLPTDELDPDAPPPPFLGYPHEVRLLNLDGFRTRYLLEGAALDMVDRGAIWLLTDYENEDGTVFEPSTGRLVLQVGNQPIDMRFFIDDQDVRVSFAPGTLVGIETVTTTHPTADAPNTPARRLMSLYVTRGNAALSLEDESGEPLQTPAGHTAQISFPEGIRESVDAFPQAPAWMSPDMDPTVRRRVERFAAALPNDATMPVAAFDAALQLRLRELAAQGAPDTAPPALAALAQMRRHEELASALRYAQSSEIALTGAAALREELRSAPAQIPSVRELMLRLYGPEAGNWIVDLLLGYSDAAQRQPATYRRLILDANLLEAEESAVRHLTIWNLTQMVGSDKGYKADSTGLARNRGVNAWKLWAERLTEKQLERN